MRIRLSCIGVPLPFLLSVWASVVDCLCLELENEGGALSFCPRQRDKKTMSTEAKPFLKWAGGKGQLLSQLDEHLPADLQRQTFTYIEPFVGGGAMLFYMLRKFANITHAVINDINSHLVTAYRVIKEQPDELIQRLSDLEHDYFSQSDEEAKKDYFLNVRETSSMRLNSTMLTAQSICCSRIALASMACTASMQKGSSTCHLAATCILRFVMLKPFWLIAKC